MDQIGCLVFNLLLSTFFMSLSTERSVEILIFWCMVEYNKLLIGKLLLWLLVMLFRDRLDYNIELVLKYILNIGKIAVY